MRGNADHPQTFRVTRVVTEAAFYCADCDHDAPHPVHGAGWHWLMRVARAGGDGRLRCPEHHADKYGDAPFLVCRECEQAKPAEEWDAPSPGEVEAEAEKRRSMSEDDLRAYEAGQAQLAEMGVFLRNDRPRNYVVSRWPCHDCRDAKASRTCSECEEPLPPGSRADSVTCSDRCRQRRRRRLAAK